MENAFRGGQVIVFERPDNHSVVLEHLNYGQTMGGGSWRELGLSEHPSEQAKRTAKEAFQAWGDLEIFPLTDDDSNRVACLELQSKSKIELVNARSKFEVDHVAHVLTLLPSRSLASGGLKTIDLNGGERVDSSQVGKFDPAKGELALYNHYYTWDRYLFTRVLLHQLGYVVYAALGEREKQTVRALFADCLTEDAVLGAFATNYMHFVIERAGMISRANQASNQGQRRKIFVLFNDLLSSVS